MNKTKLIAVAAGFLAAAGLITAGNIKVNGETVGTYSGNVTVTGTGDLLLPSNTKFGDTSGGSTNQCDGDPDATYNPDTDSCDCPSGTTWNGFQCAEDSSSEPPGGGNDAPANCSGGAGTQDSGWSRFSHFPKSTGDKDRFTIDNGKYLAIQFTAPGADRAGYIGTAADSHAMNDQHAMAISRCPGEFDENLGAGLCRKSSASHTFWWSTFGTELRTACELTPGETYYLNIKYARLSNLSSITCGGSIECGALLFWSNYN